MEAERIAITGAGLVSPLGSNPAEIWSNLESRRPWASTYDAERFAPYLYHPEKPFDAEAQIGKRTLVRSMGRSQLNAVYAAGLALQAAGVRDREPLLAETELIAACGVGDSDGETDEAILRKAAPHDDGVDALLNQSFMGLRPTLYLNQLPNLFAANISICHGVIGSSVTYIGDEVAGMNAFHAACRRIRAGQSERVLVGGAAEGGRRRFLESYAARDELVEGGFSEIWSRTDNRVCFGNGAGFLVLESERRARARGAAVKCYVADVQVNYAARTKGAASYSTERLLQAMGGVHGASHVVSSSNVYRATLTEEEDFWRGRGAHYQNLCNVFGGMMEASFPMAVALAVLCLERGAYLPPISSRHEPAPHAPKLARLLVGCWGRERSEALALLETQEGSER